MKRLVAALTVSSVTWPQTIAFSGNIQCVSLAFWDPACGLNCVKFRSSIRRIHLKDFEKLKSIVFLERPNVFESSSFIGAAACSACFVGLKHQFEAWRLPPIPDEQLHRNERY